MSASQQGKSKEGQPALAYVAGAIGLILTLGLMGFIGREALVHPGDHPPVVQVQAKKVDEVAGGYVVEFEARNLTQSTASAVEVEATLEIPGSSSVNSKVTLDYVPGNSVRKGGVYLPSNPADGKLTLRATGYSDP